MKKLILLLLFVLMNLGCQIEPRVLKFRPPPILEETSNALPEIKFAGSQQLEALYSREVNGMDKDYLLEYFMGSPHQKINLNGFESWVYYFQRVRPSMRPPHDVRLIKVMNGNPPNLAVALKIQNNKVTAAYAPWFNYKPVSAADTERFFGKPDKRQLGKNGEEYYYRFVSFCSYEKTNNSGDSSYCYILNEVVLKVEFAANGNYNGYNLYLVGRSKVVIFSDNSVQDPATNKSWTLRRPRVEKKAEGEDSSGNTTERGSALINLITYKLNGLDKPGKVSAAFGWPSYQSHSQDGRTRTDTYPLKRPGSPNAFLLVTSKAISDQFEVVSMAMKWIGGMPKTPQELRIKFGEPDQVFGSVASGFQKFVYNYQLSTEPFIVGHPKKFRYGISIVFSIRSGVKLLDEVEIKKITY